MSKIYFIGAGPGDVELITIKGLNALKRCEIVVYAGSLVNRSFLKYADNMLEHYDSSSMTLDEIADVFETAKRKNYNIARLHTGDASLYGAIAEQIKKAEDAGFEYEVIPGVSALFAAASAMGIELTKPQVSQTVTITRVEGKTPMPKDEALDKILSHGGTFCFYLSILKIDEIVNAFIKKGFSRDTPVCVCYKVSLEDEIIIEAALSDISKKVKEKNITRQAIIIVGEVLNDDIEHYSKLYDKDFVHGFRK